LPIPDVHLARYGERHRGNAPDGAAVLGGLYVPLGPTVGATITILATELLRIWFGTGAVGWDNLVYGILLVVVIIFLPQGLLGPLRARLRPRQSRVA